MTKTVHLIWIQAPYEEGHGYRVAGDRKAAARIIKELREEMRGLLDYVDICRKEMTVEGGSDA
jgi:hypothetical protein